MNLLFEILKGGSGSGNFDHAGIPGHRGGSAPRNYQLGKRKELLEHYAILHKCRSVECDSIRAYTGSYYKELNNYLRHGKSSSEERAEWITNTFAPEIDRAIENGPRVPKDLIVFRGLNKEIVNNLEIGVVFEDKGFVSTTIKKDALSKDGTILGTQKKEPAILEIRVPKNSKGLYIEHLSRVKSENEFLLPRGSKFKVVETLKNQPIPKIIVELIDET